MIKKTSATYMIVGDANNLIFVGSLVFYLLLILIENIFQGFVSTTFNPHYLLFLIVVSGIVAIFIHPEAEEIEKGKKSNSIFDYSLIFFLAIVGFAAVLYASRELENIKWIIAVMTGMLILVIGGVLQYDEENE